MLRRFNSLLLVAAVTSLSSLAMAAPFSVVMLPDTQHYSDSATDIVHFDAQTQWIVDNQAAENIVFTTLVGDVVQNGGVQTEWDRAVGALDTLQNDVADPAYSTVPGNHDYDVVGNKSSAVLYISNVGPARYAAKTWFVDNATDQLNMAQSFTGDGQLFLHIGLEWLPSDTALLFAQDMILANPGVPVIVSTHQHLEGSARELGNGATPNDTGDNNAEQVYQKLVQPFPEVFLVLSGHDSGGENGRIDSTTILGRPVHEIMADYQSDPNGGNGWFQLLEFRPDDDEIEFETISPTYVSGVTAGPDRSVDPSSNFTLDFDVNELLNYLSTRVVLHYRQGQDNGFGVYSDSIDTHVGNGAAAPPDTSHGTLDVFSADGDSDLEQGLLKFGSFEGVNLGQVPAGTIIQKAILTLTNEGSGSDGSGVALHRMLVPWTEDVTWNDLGGGITLGVDALATEEANTGSLSSKGTRSFDVTTTVQAWLDGAPNHGWALLNNATNRVDFRSSEWVGVVERPMLTIDYSTVPVPPSPEPFVQIGHFSTGYSGGTAGGTPLTVPSIDPAGITYHPPSGHLFIADSEINEVGAVYPVPIGANLFETSLDGTVLHNSWDLNDIGTDNDEPTGIVYNEFDQHFYSTNDAGENGVFRYSYDGVDFVQVDHFPMPGPPGGGGPDPEGITHDPATGRMWVADGFGNSFVQFTYSGGSETIEANVDLAVVNTDPNERPSDPEGITYSPTTGHLYFVDTPSLAIWEMTTAGVFVAKHSLASLSPPPDGPQGGTVVPVVQGDRQTVRMVVVDGRLDNNEDGNERDGSVYTFDLVQYVCDDGIDNDTDGDIDGADSGCTDDLDLSEELDCEDGIDNDGDGDVDDGFDAGCFAATDESELDAALPCDDGIDNDLDGLADFRLTGSDLGCGSTSSPTESPRCQDGIDNDGLRGTDFDGGESILGVGNGDPFGADPNCASFSDNTERSPRPPVGCGMGPELALLLPLLGAGRFFRRRRTEG